MYYDFSYFVLFTYVVSLFLEVSHGAAALTHFSLTHIAATLLLRLQTIKAIINSRRFKGSSCEEPRRVQVLDLYCLTRFEGEVQVEEKSIKD